ncbi:hypothetical protein [Paenibacillus agilis]|uniref:Uncharacterized protein n=1 Tax=Paenibacillus agilis TaxID=3020863 RepID=A0A559ID13_9BACL|nr:hypothetical protein [Paenibacillus agilis]TVX85559.1 hypothetical protein FPZ44_24700 [Paenibacillus agilis]
MSKIHRSLIEYNEGYTEDPKSFYGLSAGDNQEHAVDITNALVEMLGFQSARFIGLTKEGQLAFMAKTDRAQWQVSVDYDSNSGYACVRYVLMEPGRQEIHERSLYIT